MGRDSGDGTLHLGRHRHGSLRQPAFLRYSTDPVCDRHCSVAIVDRRLQSAIYRRNFRQTGPPKASRYKRAAVFQPIETRSMSALGHEQTSRRVRLTSVIPLKADIHRRGLEVRFVP